jgi:hypothetical protein
LAVWYDVGTYLKAIDETISSQCIDLSRSGKKLLNVIK